MTRTTKTKKVFRTRAAMTKIKENVYDKISSPNTPKKKTVGLRISKFIRTRRSRLRANFLNEVCFNQGQCLAFGNEIATIRKHFSQFTDFDLVSNVAKIGGNTANGFIREMTFSKDGYTSFAVLKSSIDHRSDNLAYEYLVGKHFINHYSKFFPVFLETYGMFKYRNNQDFSLMKQHINGKISGLSTMLVPKSGDDYNASICVEPEKTCILIQHVHSPISLQNLNLKMYLDYFSRDLLMPVLFQVYHALASLSDVYTHYDLHLNNILLFEIKTKTQTEGFAEFIYHLENGKQVVFTCPYIAKIIDYGRNYFNTSTFSSETIFKSVCEDNPCKDLAGNPIECRYNGMAIFGGGSSYNTARSARTSASNSSRTSASNSSSTSSSTSTINYNINFSKRNRSHDLLALSQFDIFYNEYLAFRVQTDPAFLNSKDEFFQYFNFFEKFKDASWIVEDSTMTVNTAFTEIENLVSANPPHPVGSKVGTFHIYGKSQPMEFIPEP